ncbi:MAG: hypothetical protein WC119_02020 [Synergistaceae bacterium]
MQIRNQIVSYFVDSSVPVRVFRSPVTMPSSVASEILKEEYDFNSSVKKLLHVCYDIDSKLIYLPNANVFTKDEIEPLLQAAKYYILKQYGDFLMAPPIEGSPFSSLRVRSIKSFGYVSSAIKDNFKGEIIDLPVIEANLARMQTTTKQLPEIYKNNKNFSGGLIKKGEITFTDEMDINGKKRKNPIRLLTLKAPFILIDISPQVDSSATQKEWAVLSGYRDYIMDQQKIDDAITSFAPLYAAKRYLYLGWPFEEVCKVFLECVENFGSLMTGIRSLVMASADLTNNGYADVAKYPYYMSFRIDPKTFPIKMDSKTPSSYFSILDYDKETGYIIIRSLAYIESELCLKVLKAISRPYIVKYNPVFKKIDVKVQESIHKELSIKTDIPARIKKIVEKEINEKDLEFRSDKRSRSISLSSNQSCHLRKISDYYYAKDHIEKMCKERDMLFEDIQVIVGPIERIFGRGTQGGFMGKKEFEKSKLKSPFQIEKGLYVTPPIIAVNSESMPSYASQTETLIHEYSHKLYSIINPDHEHLYNKDPKLRNKNPRKYWDLYLGDEDEKLAHKEEIAFELTSGKSIDEIVRDKVGGAITKNSYKQTYITALKFKEMVDEVAKEMEDQL